MSCARRCLRLLAVLALCAGLLAPRSALAVPRTWSATATQSEVRAVVGTQTDGAGGSAHAGLVRLAVAHTRSSSSTCRSSRARTELVRGGVRIVRFPTPGSGFDTLAFCYRGGRAHIIFHTKTEEWEPAIHHVTIAGAVLAYELTYYTDQSAGASIVHEVAVRRLGSGHLISNSSLGVPQAFPPFASVRRLVLKADGAVAWTDRAYLGEPGTVPASLDRVVKREPGSAAGVVLDAQTAAGTGPTALELRSLTLVGSALHWRSGGTERTAVLG